jgi:hypothetical protein
MEADNLLRTTESMFGLLHCIEYQKTLYAAQQLRGSAGAWWATYTTVLPTDHHVSWGKFRTAFHAHHLFAGLLRTKLKEFLDLDQGNHSVFDYTRQFNTLVQYRSYHVDTDEKKANLYHEGLTIHLQERLGQFTDLSYNELVGAAIDQERLTKAIAEADEKKRKRMMPRSSASCGSSGAPPKYCMVYTPPEVNCVDCNSSRIQSIAHNSNSGTSSSSSRNNSSSIRNSTMLLLHHHNSFLPTTSHASTTGRWGSVLMNAACPNKAIHHEPRQPW